MDAHAHYGLQTTLQKTTCTLTRNEAVKYKPHDQKAPVTNTRWGTYQMSQDSQPVQGSQGGPAVRDGPSDLIAGEVPAMHNLQLNCIQYIQLTVQYDQSNNSKYIL
jgi:hypothetical protein